MLIAPHNLASAGALAQRWQSVRARIATAAQASGRNEDQITLLAVSKGQAPAAIRTLADLGHKHFGENYLQEALPKIEALADPTLSWHYIGRLQANKTRSIAGHFAWVHGLDRLHIAERLSAQRPQHAPPLQVCVQVNIAGDPAKSGVTVDAVASLAAAVQALPQLRLRGLMCMLPENLASADRPRCYRELAALLATLPRAAAAPDTLSMGMSDDFELAISAGATLVRIGTALFGPRA